MSNKGRCENGAGTIVGGRSKLTPTQKLETLQLYPRYQNTNRVGELLDISGAAVRDRLHAMRVKIRPVGDSTIDVVELNGRKFLGRLQRQLQAAVNDPAALRLAPRLWTPEEERLLQTDATAEELARRLRRSLSAVRARRTYLYGRRGSKRRWTPQEDAIVLQSGQPVAAIATQLGRTPSSIHQRRRRLRQN